MLLIIPSHKQVDQTRVRKTEHLTHLALLYVFQGMHNQDLFVIPPIIHHIEGAGTPMVDTRHSRENANILSSRNCIRLEDGQRNFI